MATAQLPIALTSPVTEPTGVVSDALRADWSPRRMNVRFDRFGSIIDERWDGNGIMEAAARHHRK